MGSRNLDEKQIECDRKKSKSDVDAKLQVWEIRSNCIVIVCNIVY